MLTDDEASYAADVPYTLGFYRELAPAFLDFVAISNGAEGLAWGRPLRYCELGCGRGYGTVLLAAANPDMHVVGVDFDAEHIDEARRLAAAAALSNVEFHHLSFAQMQASYEPALRGFDIMALHGVYSWVAPSVRNDLHLLLMTRLNEGGLAYVSYNAMPGWAAMAPAQKLVLEIARRTGGSSLDKFDAAHATLRTLVNEPNGYLTLNPAVRARIDRMQGQDRRYLAHEYLNGAWAPLYVTDALDALAGAGLVFVGSAGVAENRVELSVPPGLREAVAAAPDPAMRELLKDFAINKGFRRDVYIKGKPRMLGSRRQAATAALMLARTGFVAPPEKLKTPAGDMALPVAITGAALARLDAGPVSLLELAEALRPHGVQPANVPMLVDVLIHNGLVAPARPDHATVDRAPAQRLNAHVMQLAAAGDTHRYLAAPAIGSALPIHRYERLVGAALLAADGEPQAAVPYALAAFASAGLSFDGAADTGAAATRMADLVARLETHGLPRWRGLGIA